MIALTLIPAKDKPRTQAHDLGVQVAVSSSRISGTHILHRSKYMYQGPYGFYLMVLWSSSKVVGAGRQIPEQRR